MAEFKLGRIRFVWKNQWTASTVYYQDDVIAFGGKTYICVIGHTSQNSFFSDLDITPSKWNLVSEGQTWKGEWQPDTDYVYDDIVSYGARVYICNTIHTSASTAIDETDGLEADLSKWTPFAEGLDWKGEWSTNTRYRINDFVKYGGSTYVCNTLHVSAANSADGLELDISNWDVFNQSLEYKGSWTSSTRYKLNDLVRYGAGVWICTEPHSSSSEFGTDSLNWTKFVEGFQYENEWSPYVSYQPGDVVRYGGNQYIADESNNASQPPAHPSLWRLFSEGFKFIGDWNEDSANQEYKVGEIVRLGGFTYICLEDHANQQPPNPTYWRLINEGFRWRGEWLDDQEYFEGDIVRYGDNSYVCVKYHISEGDDFSTQTLVQPGGGAAGSRPDLADSGQYWAVIAVGTEQSVLTTTGDLVYFSGSAPTRLPIGQNGQVLKVGTDGLPKWEFLQSVDDVYFVAEHGVDEPYPIYGGTLDRPWKTIRYATEQIEKGTKNPNTSYLIKRNRTFIQREVSAWIRDQVENATSGSIWENFTYDTLKCERDVGFVIDRILYDLTHGGNLKTRAAAQTFLNALDDGPYSTAEENNGTGPYANLAGEKSQSVAAYNYMLGLIESVINNETPTVIYQNVTDDSTAIVDQYLNINIEAESGSFTRITELANIVINAIQTGLVSNIPDREVSQTLIKVSTGKYYETLPIIVPAYCAILGDELRSTHIIAGEATIPESDNANTIATFDRIASIVSDIVIGTPITPSGSNTSVQDTSWPVAISDQSTVVEDLVYMMKYQIDYRLNTMHSAYLTDPTGYSSSLENARENIRANIKFIIEETIAYLADQYPTLRYGKTDTRRDARYVIDALIYDLTYGGNAQSIKTGLAYWGGDDTSNPQIPTSIKAATIASLNFLKTTAQSVATNTLIISPQQTLIEQTVTGNVGSGTEIANLVEEIIDIIDNGPSAATLTDPTPSNGVNSTTALINAYNTLAGQFSTIQSNTISWINSNYPSLTYDSAKCSRDIGIILKAIGYDFMFNSNWQTLKAAHSYLRGSASEVYTLNQKTVTRAAIEYALKTLAVANVGGDTTAQARIQASADIIDAIIFGATNEGSVCQTEDANVYYAMDQLEKNREFIKAEISAWISDQIATATDAGDGSIWDGYTYDNALCLRDVDLYIDALIYDLKYPGNYKSRYVGRYYANAVTGSQEEDMFYLRDATGVRNCSLFGLNGDLTPPNVYGTSRCTAGAYCSLDPGFGPEDFTTWIISRSPYVQGVTTFGNAATGQKIDGALHNGGNDSIVSNDFTQVISDGIGAHILNNGRAELVSVFTYYSHVGYLAETGGRIRATNGNNSYGEFGSVAEGVDPDEIPVTAIVDNITQYKATISNVFTDNVSLLSFEYGHAGNDYTEAEIDIFGPGTGSIIVPDEFRDNALNYVLIDQDANPDIPIGGSGYVITSNVAQSGSTTGIFLSATDGALSTAYPGMKLYVIGGTGIGQFGIISTYNAGSKEATIIRESDGQAGWDHVVPGTPIVAPNSSSTYQIEPRIAFSAPPKSNGPITLPASTTWYDVKYIETAEQYTGVAGFTNAHTGTQATFDVTRNGSKYYVTINNAGTGYERLETVLIEGTSVGGESPANDLTITITTVNSVTGAIVDYDFVGVAQKGLFLAVGAGTNGAKSVDGVTWSVETLPSLTGGNWSSIASGLIDDGSSTFKPSYVVIVADGSTTVGYSPDADTWLNTSLPGSFNGSGENNIAYGQVTSVTGRFVVIGDADRDVVYSDDGGANWLSTTDALPAVGFDSLTYGAGKFVAINSGTTSAAYSTDGITWTGVTLPGTAATTNVVWGNGRFLCLGGANGIMYSLDGITWYENDLSMAQTVTERKLSYGQGMFVITSDDTDQVQYSEDGLYWQAYTLSTTITGGYNAVAFGNPGRDGRFVILPNASGTGGSYAKLGVTARGRASVSNEQIFEIRITEPGSGYTSVPTVTVTDPNNVDDVVLVTQLGDGVLGQPTFVNRGTGYITASAEVDANNSNGNAEFPQSGNFIAVRRLSKRPVNGSNVVFDSLSGRFFKLVNTVSFLGTNDGSYTGFLQISPNITVEDGPPNGDPVELRIRFSQVRLTGHDFLDVGTGGVTTTNYPNTPLVQPNQANETVESNGGRVFYTSTDQDGNFRVGDLFTIEQSTGVATLNADAFNIAGLQELSLGEVTLGGNSATVNEFSTDPFFTANSDNIVPTQRAVKAYIESQIGGGGASLNVNSVTAGDIFIGTDTITSLTGQPINIKANVVFSGTVLGLPLAYNYFLR